MGEKTADELKQLCALAYPVFVAKMKESGEDADNGEDGDFPAWENLEEEVQNAWCAFAETVLEKQHHTIYRDTAVNRF